MHERLTKLIHLCFYLLIFITPLLMSNQTSEMFEFPKMLTIYIISATVFALWIIDFIVYRRTVHVPPLAIAVGVFLASQMLSTVTSIDIHTSLFGYYGRFNGGLLSILAYTALFFVAYQTFDTRTFRTLLKVSLVASIVVLFWGLPGRLLGVDMSCILYRGEFSTSCWTNEFRPQERMFSTLGQPNWLGVYLTMHVFMGLFLWITHFAYRSSLRGSAVLRQAQDDTAETKQSHIKNSLLYTAYILLTAFGVVLTGSRSSEIGLCGGVFMLVLIYLWQQGKKNIVKMLALSALLSVLLFGAWYAYRLSHARADKITHSGTIRLIVWEGALKLAARYPLTGTGPETFAYSYFLTRPEAHNYTTEKDLIYNKAHNEFLNFLATTGLIGFTAYVFMLYMMIRVLMRSREGFILACGIVAISIANFFGFSTTTGQVLLFLIPVYGLLSKENPSLSSRVLPFSIKVDTSALASSSRLPADSAGVEGSLEGVYGERSRTIRVDRYLDTLRRVVSLRWIQYPSIIIAFVGWCLSMNYFYQYYEADLAYARATSLQYSQAYIESIDAFAQALGYRFEHIYADKFALTVAQTAYLLSQADKEKVYDTQIQSYITMAQEIQTAALRSSPRNPMYWKDRVRMYRMIESVVPEKERPHIALQISAAIDEAARLAPTDLEVREMKNSNSK